MNLTEKTKLLLEKEHLQIKENYGQHFLVSELVIANLIRIAQIGKEDVILEIGTGTGNLTRELAQNSQKVIALELDPQFQPVLKKLPANVELIFGNAIEFLASARPKADFNKIVANLPYQLGEPLMHYLCRAKQIQLTVLIVSQTFLAKMQQNPFFTAFISFEKVEDIPRDSFYPLPKIDSVIIRIKHKPDSETKEDETAFLFKELYWQKNRKLKNGLREALINLHWQRKHRQLTKKEAQEKIKSLTLESKKLETVIERLPLEFLVQVAARIKQLDNC